MSIRDLIENDSKPEVKEFQVSFGKIFVKEIPYSFLKKLMQNTNDRDVLLETVGNCLCEEDGTPVYKPEEFHKLEKLSVKKLKEIEAAAVEFNSPQERIVREKKD